MLVYKKIFQYFVICLLIISSGNVDNCIASELQFRVLYDEKIVNEPLSIVVLRYTISVEQYYTDNEYKRIICYVVKDIKREGGETIALNVSFRYKLDKWTRIDEFSEQLGPTANQAPRAAFYTRIESSDSSALSSLDIYYDKDGNKLDKKIVVEFDHTCNCEKISDNKTNMGDN